MATRSLAEASRQRSAWPPPSTSPLHAPADLGNAAADCRSIGRARSSLSSERGGA